MRKRKSKSSFCQVDHLELRQLLSATIYVSAAATGATHDGLSWATAFTDLQSGLTAAAGDTPSSSNPVIIEVGQGTYYPTAGTDRTATFQLIDDVSIQGGYAGAGASNPDARDVTLYPTTLSGDIGTTGKSGYSYHVVTASGTDSTAVLDGFTITDGDADGNGRFEYRGGGIFDNAGNPIISNCTITGNTGDNGGGMYNQDASPTLTNCTITENTVEGSTAGQGGGGVYNRDSSPTLLNCTISGNTSGWAGGGIYNIAISSPTLINTTITGNAAVWGGGINNDSSSPTLTNCTLSGNTATHGGGAMDNYAGSDPTLVNCILWGDSVGASENEIDNLGSGTATITYSDIDDASFINSSNHVIDNDPLFANAAAGNFGLAGASPAINAGSNAAVVGINTDLAGNSRIVGGIVDMGAYEYQTAQPIYLNQSATGLGNGTSWANAFTDLQTALSAVAAGAVIDVAAGDYSPGTADTDTFQLKSGVTLQGGYATGGSTSPTPSVNVTILDGKDINYHVVTASGTDSTAVLNGFTITGGNANGGGSNANGGGIFDNAGSPTISNCTISGNSALQSGGGIYDNAGNPIISNCTITGNTGDIGGGMYNDHDSSPMLTNCTISGNTADRFGGGIFNAYSSPTLINCTISGNTAGGGGGILNAYSSPTLTNCILWGDTASPTDNEIDNVGSGTATITYSDIDGGYAGAGNIDSDPHFIRNVGTNGPTDYGDLELQGASPAINAGSNAAVPMGVTTDLAGNPRISDGTVDLGAYETQAHLAITAQPTGSVTAGSIFSVTVKVEDPEGNAITNDNSNFTLTLGTGGPAGASLNGTLNATADDGVASFTGLSLDRAGTYSLVSSNGNLPVTTSNNFTITAAAPAALVITQQPGDSTAGQDIPAVQVEVEDQYGNLADDSSVNVALSGSTGASLGGTTELATSGGVASFSDLVLTQAGSYTLSITDGDLPGQTSSSFTINPAAAAKLAFTLEPANATAGQTMANFAIEVQDQYGNLITSDTSTVAIASTPAGISTSIAAVDGIAIFVGVTPDTAGTFTLSASDGSLAGATSSSFTINSAAAATLVVTQQPGNGVAGQTMPNFAVEVQDQYGNFITSDTSTVAIASTPAGIATSIAAVDGIAIFTGLSTDTAGTYTLSASDGSLAGATSSSFTITPGAAATLVITQQPASTLAGQNIPVQVEVEDQYGNAVDGTSVTLALAGSAPSGAILAGTLTEPTANGIAAFGDLSLNRAGTFTLSASDGNLPAATSQSFAITYAGPQLVFASEPANAVAGGKLPAFTIDTDDTAGNIVTGGKSKITLTLSSGGKIYGSAKATVNKKTGMATFKNISLHTAGTYTLTAADSSYASGISTEFTISAGAAKKLIFDPQPQNAAAASPFNVSVELVNQYGNAVNDGSTVDLVLGAHPKTAASLNSSAAVSDGFADFDDVTLDTAGPYTLTASDGKLKATSKKFEVA